MLQCMRVGLEEIKKYISEAFTIEKNNKIIGKSDPFQGERYFILCSLEQIMGQLSLSEKNDHMIIQQTRILLCASRDEKEDSKFLKTFDRLYRMNNLEILNEYERQFISEMMECIYAEYLTKSEFVECCYSAMAAFANATYCILKKGIYKFVSKIDIVVDIYDEVVEIELEYSEKKSEHILIDWHSTNKINDMYMLYKTQYCGLCKESILDLVSADVIEKEYYLNDERFTIAPSILMKQYLAIIEREVNQIIQLSDIDKKPDKHLKWYDMKNLVRKRGITIEYLDFKLSDALEALYKYRNHSMHGEIDITHEDYAVLCKYKNADLFMGLSVKKLELQNIQIHPTISEISKMIE